MEKPFEEVAPGKLRVRIDTDPLGFDSTEVCKLFEGIIGQERSIKAVQMGLEIESPGYNIYAAGLTGNQGVMVSALNLPDLMLRKDVVPAVSEGKFHIYPIGFIDTGITILAGVSAGKRDIEGRYPEGTVNFLVDERLKAIAKRLKTFGEEEKNLKRKIEAPRNKLRGISDC